MTDILDKAKLILEEPVCDHCLGRQFAMLLCGYTNDERGRVLREIVAMSIDEEKFKHGLDESNFSGIKFHNLEVNGVKKTCAVCGDIFDKLGKWADKIKKYKGEYKTFLVGTKLTFDLIEREEELWSRVGIDYCEPLKAELNREIGKLVEGSGEFEPKNPDIAFVVNLKTGKLEVTVNPIFIFGEYQKLKRGIPQTKWPSGKYKTSVEQIIAKPFMKITKGKEHKFHGCVRGDTQILLGNRDLIPIEKLSNWKDLEILTYSTEKKCVEESKLDDFFKIKMDTYKLKTNETGRKIVATPEHPFFTPKGMKVLSDLKKGDLVAVTPIENFDMGAVNSKTIIDKKHISQVIDKFVPTSYKNKIFKELAERDILPLKTSNSKIFALTRILAFLFGDGNVRYTRGRDVGVEFYGYKKNLINIQKDLKNLGFKSSILTSRRTNSIVKDYYGKKKLIRGHSHGFRLLCHSKSLWSLLVSLGAPVGDKIVNEFEFPNWVKCSGKRIKREFIASLFGCEMDKPRLDNRKYNRKSFNTPRFSLNKIESKLDNLTIFMNDIKKILLEFGVKTHKLRYIPYTTRKDGHKSIKVILDINNNYENLINLYGRIGFIYCHERDVYSKYVLEYLSMKKYYINKRRKLFKRALLLKNKGLSLSDIHRRLGSEHIKKTNLWLWLHGNIKLENIKIQNDFPNFDVWFKTATKNLKDGLVWETVDFIEKGKEEIVYNLTVPKNHNFFANGFLISNCGREDIDALCLGWRPFVLEITEPVKRGINLRDMKKKIGAGVEVRKLKLVNSKDVAIVKESRPDKTYRAVVVCDSKIDAKDVKLVKELKGVINQQTPTRVLHRRADLVRKRNVKEIRGKLIGPKKMEIVVKTDAGAYIKELISGDGGRTKPSLSGLIGKKFTCKELDVIKIHTK